MDRTQNKNEVPLVYMNKPLKSFFPRQKPLYDGINPSMNKR